MCMLEIEVKRERGLVVSTFTVSAIHHIHCNTQELAVTLQSDFRILLHFSNIKRQDYFILMSIIMFIFSSRQWLKSEDIQRISLLFYNKTLEKEVSYFHCKFTADSFFASS